MHSIVFRVHCTVYCTACLYMACHTLSFTTIHVCVKLKAKNKQKHPTDKCPRQKKKEKKNIGKIKS